MSNYKPPNKAIKDMTPEELEAFKQYFIEQLSPEERESWAKIGQAFSELSQSPEIKVLKEGIQAIGKAAKEAQPYIEAIRDLITYGQQFLPLFLEELEGIEQNPDEDISDFIEREDVKAAAHRAADRMGIPDAEPVVESLLPHLTSILPDKHIIPNTKLSNILTTEPMDGVQGDLEVIPKKGKRPAVVVPYVLSYEGENVHLTTKKPYTEYDRNIQNAIASLYRYGTTDHVITAALVYRAMTGASESDSPSPQQLGAITRSIEKQRRIHAVIDCTEELKQRGLPIDRGAYDNFLIVAEGLEVEAGGKSIKAWRVQEPMLLNYAERIGQVITVPAALLEIRQVDPKTGRIGNKIANTELNIQIKGYLLRRIEGMKNPDNNLLQKTISLVSYDRGKKHHAGLYEVIGKPAPTKTEANRIRNYIANVLEYWIAESYITGYTFTKTGRAITGIEISL